MVIDILKHSYVILHIHVHGSGLWQQEKVHEVYMKRVGHVRLANTYWCISEQESQPSPSRHTLVSWRRVIISLQSNSQVYIHWIEVFFIQLLVEHLELEMEMEIEIHRAVEMGLQHVPNSFLDGKFSFLLELDLP